MARDPGKHSSQRALRTGVVLVVIAMSGFGVVQFARQQATGDAASPQATALALEGGAAAASPAAGPRFERLANPGRTVVRDQTGAVIATFTDGARTVAMTGPTRTFTEPRFTTATITTNTWVRLTPEPWAAGAENAAWFGPWFEKATTDPTSPDVFAVAMEYFDGAPAEKNPDGLQFRGDAIFGPVEPSGVARLEQSDFLDYLGIPYSFPDVSKKPKPAHRGALDCSGFVRMVYGFRLDFPLLGTNDPGPGLPRRAWAMAENGPGVALIPNTGTRVTDYEALQPGDLVFFEVEGSVDELDHVGVFIGLDSDGHYRFMSSRERANGPTFGDLAGTSLLDDGGTYSRAWRAARRI